VLCSGVLGSGQCRCSGAQAAGAKEAAPQGIKGVHGISSSIVDWCNRCGDALEPNAAVRARGKKSYRLRRRDGLQGPAAQHKEV
jgi:hypothetical protein